MTTPATRVLFAGGGTGGHLYPGLAIARALVKLDPGIQPFFIGAKRGIEREVLPQSEFKYEFLDLHPLYRSRVWRNAQTLIGGTSSWRRLNELVRQLRPACVVGTGGYASALTLALAWRKRIPFIVQEQNSYPGLTTRFFSRFAAQVHLGFPEAQIYLNPGRHTKILVSGNPIEPPPKPLPDKLAARDKWDFPRDSRPVVLVFGGSQGSAAINNAVAIWVKRHAGDEVYVIWATGRGNYDRYTHLASGKVKILPYISPMSDAYAAANLVVSRAGAMASAELSAWGIPGIFIPLPTAAADHQTSNAMALADAGAGRLLMQRDLTPETLGAAIHDLVIHPEMLRSMSEIAMGRSKPDAAQVIAGQVLEQIRSRAR